jgi:hypothetical protein
VSCQEVGHTLGLAHQDENFNNANLGTYMDYKNNQSTNQHPSKHDYDQLLHLFASRQQTQPSMCASTQTDLPWQCKTIQGLSQTKFVEQNNIVFESPISHRIYLQAISR